MPMWMAMSFQDSNSPIMEHIMFFHDHAMIILIMVTILTFYMTLSMMSSKNFNKFLAESQEMEIVWTMIPMVMLMFIALPSLKILYLMEESKSPSMTIKVTGHQWYWSYEYSPLMKEENEMESFMDNSKIMRLLKTSEMIYVPVNTTVRALITSNDVIHSWAIPSLGIKVDALPGRLNQTFLSSKRIGIYTGQCSEICGTNHSFMPILTLFTSPTTFMKKMMST